MTCLACGNRAFKSFLTSIEAVRSGDAARNLRYSSTEASRRPVHISSLAPLQRSQARAQGCHTALFPIRGGGRREEPSLRVKSVSATAIDQTFTIPGKLITILSFRPYSLKCEGYLKPKRWSKNGASVEQDLLRANMKGLGRRSYATYLPGDGLTHVESLRCPKLADLGKTNPLRVYSSRASEDSKGAMISTRSAKSADSRTGTQRYKDQREPWQIQKKALADKFGPTGWLPRKRLSPDTLDGIRALHTQYPDKFTTPILADQFKVSPEAIRRILKSKWRPNDEEEERRRRRWEKRGKNIWSQMVELGIKPPKKWRIMGVGKSTQRQSARSIQLESQIKSKSKSKSLTTSLLGQPVTDTLTTKAIGHKTQSPVLLSDRIL